MIMRKNLMRKQKQLHKIQQEIFQVNCWQKYKNILKSRKQLIQTKNWCKIYSKIYYNNYNYKYLIIQPKYCKNTNKF